METKERRRVQIQEPESGDEDRLQAERRLRFQASKATEYQEPFMGVKVRRRGSINRQYQGDYINVASNQPIVRLLTKHGDKQVSFADNIMKINKEGQIKRRILLITDISLYTLDARWLNIKRYIPLASIERLLLSELNDNFFAVIVPSQYDCLLASTRKTEIVTTLVEAVKKVSDTPLEVVFSNSFQYYIDAENAREVRFEEVEGGVKTKIVKC